mmetsp:Transcript_12088/g.29520  ORF Transcript_12088/g.29520 Transcript_12088/m.29520 type:complete len:379 (-) Transcript_12088:181-1317(-)
MDSQAKDTLLLPQDESPPQHHPGMQQHSFIGFGVGPNWGGFGQMMQPGYHHSVMQPGVLDGSQLIPGLAPSMDPLEGLLGPFPCARVCGLPFEATIEDVLVFFQGLVVIDVVLLSHQDSGEAFVVFANPMDFQMGLQRDRQNMGNHYLEIFQGKRSDYYAAIATQHCQWNGSSVSAGNNGSIEGEDQEGVKTVSGASCGVDDSCAVVGESAQSFVADETVRSKSFSTSLTRNNSSQKDILSGNTVGSSYRPRGGNYGRRAVSCGGKGSKGHNSRGGHGGGIREGSHTGFIRLRGLPFHATKQDIVEFFKDYKPIESSILLTHRVDGRATGEGYVAFDDATNSKAAMTMHRSTIGSRYIELFISNKDEHTRNVARSSPS